MNILVTGAYGNLGTAVVKKFLQQGAVVTGTRAPNEQDSFFTHPQFSSFVIDLADEKETANFLRQHYTHTIPDAAVLTVGGFAMGDIENTSLAAIQKMMRLNFDTAFNCLRPLFTRMIAKGRGHIFVVGARPALSAEKGRGMTAYSLSKAMLIRLAELANVEAGSSGAWTTVIVPSTIDTPQNRAAMPDADFDKWVKPETIADLVFEHYSQRKRELLVFTD